MVPTTEFPDNYLPTLDFKLQLGWEKGVPRLKYKFYRKEMTSRTNFFAVIVL